MRKHFLLLFLMALLPLAGWAAVDPVAPTAKTNLVYTGGDQQLVTAGVAETGDYYYAVVAKDADAPAYGAYTDDATAITGKNAGSYDVYFKALETAPAADADVAGATKITVTIAKKLATVTIDANALRNNPYRRVYGWKPASFTDAVINAAKDVLVTEYDGFVGTNADADKATAKANIVVNWGPEESNAYYAAGEHTFTLSINSMPNYIVSLSPSTGKWYVDKKDLIISADATTTLTYGDVFDETTASTHVTYNGFVDGEDENDLDGKLSFTSTYDAAVPAKSGVGTYSWSPSGQTSDNYNITYNNGIIVVEEKDIADDDVNIADFDAVPYNGGNQKPTVIKGGSFKGKTLTADDYDLVWYENATIVEDVITAVSDVIAGDIKNAGTYYAKITGKGNYEGVVYKAFTINKVNLGIRTANLTKVYDTNNYYTTATTVATTGDNITVVLDGLKGEDTYATAISGTPTLSLEKDNAPVDKAIDAGVYNVKISLTGVTSTNYTLQKFEVGKLTISQRVVKITVNNKTKGFGTTDPYKDGVLATAADVTVATTPATEGILEGQGHAITAYPMLKREGAEEKGTYRLYLDKEDEDHKLVIKKGENDVTANYDPQFTDGTFTIGEGNIAIWADTQTKTYGDVTVAEAKAMMSASIIGMSETEINEVQDAVNSKVVLNVPAGLKDTDLLPANEEGYSISFADFTAADVIPAEILANYSSDITKYSASAKFIVNKKALTVKPATQAHLVGEAVTATANANTIEFSEEVATEADAKAIYDALTLQFEGTFATTYVEADVLKATAAANGRDAESNNTHDGIYVDAIVITAAKVADYNAAANNYTLTAKAGQLTVSATDVVDFDATLATNTDKLTTNAGKKLNVKIKGRTLQANKWNALSLPFSISVRDLSKLLGYAIIDRFQQSGDKLSFKIYIGEIPAYTPFLVKVDENVDMQAKVFNGVIIEAPKTVTEENTTWKFINTIEFDNVEGLVYYIKPNASEDQVTLGRQSDGADLPGFYAYFTTQDGQPAQDARIYIEEPDGSTTAISAIDADGVAVKAEGWYTINGMKLEGMPTEKGIYIQNGKKVVVK